METYRTASRQYFGHVSWKFGRLIHLRPTIQLSPNSGISGEVLEISKPILHILQEQLMNSSKQSIKIKKIENAILFLENT
jgi:hypothetical protein